MPATEQRDEEVKALKKKAESIKLTAFPTAPGFRTWKTYVQNEIAGASGDPQNAFRWIEKVEEKDMTLDVLGDRGNFTTLDAKLGAAISRITQGDLSHEINLRMEEKLRPV